MKPRSTPKQIVYRMVCSHLVRKQYYYRLKLLAGKSIVELAAQSLSQHGPPLYLEGW